MKSVCRAIFISLSVAFSFGLVTANSQEPASIYSSQRDLITCDNVADNADRINESLRSTPVTHLRSGYCRIQKTIHVPSGHSLIGEGRATTHIVANQSFNKSLSSIIECEPREPGCTIDGISVSLEQPDTDDRSKLIVYPAAIKVVNAPRARLSHLRVTGARVGIDAQENTGGLIIDDLEISAFDVAVELDGALDTVRLNDVHIWPFGLTKGQFRISSDTHTIGIKSGRVDGLFITGLMALDIQNSLLLYDSNIHGGSTFGSMINSGLDDASSFVCQGTARFTIVATYWTVGSQRDSYNLIDGCSVIINASQISTIPQISGSLFRLSSSVSRTETSFSNSIVRSGSSLLNVFFLDSKNEKFPIQLSAVNDIFDTHLNVVEVNSRGKDMIDGLIASQIRYLRNK